MPKPIASTQARLFDTCTLTRKSEADAIINAFLPNWKRYVAIAKKLKLPPQLIAVIHYREKANSFQHHLHNGDPLTGRTKLVPAGRPLTGTPPFTFEESATDALCMKHLNGIGDVSIGRLLVILENYNGLGYAFRGKPSPYVWAGTNQYLAGKYVADGVYDGSVVDKQCGTAALLLRLHERGIITLRGEDIDVVVEGKPKASVPGFAIRGVSYVGVRAWTEVFGGTLTVVKDGQAVIALGGRSVALAMPTFDGTGYAIARDLAAFYGVSLAYTSATRTLKIGGAK